MKLKLVQRINELIAEFNANTDLCGEQVRKLALEFNNEDVGRRFHPDYINDLVKDRMDDIISNNLKANKALNEKLKGIIDEIKPLIISNKVVITDKQIRISNALQLLQLEGRDITDDVAFDILKAFVDDYEQMKIFKRVVSKYIELEDTYGNSTFPKTFGMLNKMEKGINAVNEIELIVNTVFLNELQKGESIRINGITFSTPINGYQEMQDEAQLVSNAEIIEEYVTNNDFLKYVAEDTSTPNA